MHGPPYRQQVRDHNSDRVLGTLLKEGRGAVDVTGLGEFPFGDGARVGHEVVLA